MPRYRIDVQIRIPWPSGPQEFYYYAQTFYAECATLDILDTTIDTIFYATNRGHINEARLDWQHIVDLSTGLVFRNAAISWPPNTFLPGSPAGLCNTVFVAFQNQGRQVGYKRLRVPLRPDDIDGISLTISARDYFQNNYANWLCSAGTLCNVHGEIFETGHVSPYVHGWQLRHGTLRARRRRYHA